jgi:hypothetical protein
MTQCIRRWLIAASMGAAASTGAFAQVTPAAGYTPPDDTPSFKVGAVIFGDYTYQQSPTSTDADDNTIHASSFNVGRAYINVTGNLNHRIAFRITPDISRETSSTSSLAGSQEYRLKYAYAQLNLDDRTNKGSWLKAGVQQTPYIDLLESIYRYRFQGTVFTERIGFFSSSDAGLTGRWVFPGNYGDVQGGFYNGEGYSKAEVNNKKALQLRATVRPLPLGGPELKGIRLTAFLDNDYVVGSAKRWRGVGAVTYEHDLGTVAFEYGRAKDRSSITKPEIESVGWSVWALPKFGATGWEMLLRHDDFKPNKALGGQKTKRNIAGLAYWLPNLQKVTTALMVDYDSLQRSGVSPSVPKDTRYGLKMLINF